MFHKTILTFIAAAVLLLTLSSCTENAAPPGSAAGVGAAAAAARPAPPPLATEPIGLQMTRAEPRLVGTPFRVLLDFERPTDLAFLLPSVPADAPRAATDRAHTGSSALKFEHGGAVAVKLGSLLGGGGGGAFPGVWTLAGAYFSNAGPSPASVNFAYRTASSAQPLLERTVEIAPGQTWTPIFLDLTALTAGASAEVGLLNIQVASGQGVYCDDVVLVNNAKTLEEPAAGAAPLAGWTIRQGGCAIEVVRPAHFRVTLKTPEAVPDGWINEEANDVRARFVSATGKAWTIYADGRQYQDGQFSPLAPLGDAAAIYAQQHGSPAEIVVAEEQGRIDRDTPGDKNNDGYNETRGSYQLIAKGPHFEVTLKPTTRLLARPVLEIAGLPAGSALATVEGRLIEKSTRLPGGNLLLEIPLVLERATTINIAIK